MYRPAALAACALLAGCHARSLEPAATHAWVRLNAVPGNPAAAYVTVTAPAGDTLVKVESALASRVEMHEEMKSGGMMTMAPLARVDIPADGRVAFAPGGKHLMLFDIDPVVKPGTAIPLRFGFASGRTTEAEAKTVAAGEDAPY